MSFPGGLFFTNRGRALQAKAQTGVELNFTRIGVGDGQLGGQAIDELTALISEKKSLTLNKFKTLPSGKAVVGGILSNQGLVTGFYWRELGLFATDPDLGEILYCYGNAGVLAEYIPAGGGAEILEKQVDVVSLIGNAANVSATIDQSLLFASQEDLLDHASLTDTAHGAVSAATASTIMLRDANARSKVAAPAAADDIALKSTVTADIATHAGITTGVHGVGASTVESASGAQGKVDTHNAVTNPHGAVSAATADRIILRDAAGRAKVVAPSATTDIALKSTVTDDIGTHLAVSSSETVKGHVELATAAETTTGTSTVLAVHPAGVKTVTDAHANNTTTAHGAVSAATASKIIIRDAAGRAKVAVPSATDDIARKMEVDAVMSRFVMEY